MLVGKPKMAQRGVTGVGSEWEPKLHSRHTLDFTRAATWFWWMSARLRRVGAGKQVMWGRVRTAAQVACGEKQACPHSFTQKPKRPRLHQILPSPH